MSFYILLLSTSLVKTLKQTISRWRKPIYTVDHLFLKWLNPVLAPFGASFKLTVTLCWLVLLSFYLSHWPHPTMPVDGITKKYSVKHQFVWRHWKGWLPDAYNYALVCYSEMWISLIQIKWFIISINWLGDEQTREWWKMLRKCLIFFVWSPVVRYKLKLLLPYKKKNWFPVVVPFFPNTGSQLWVHESKCWSSSVHFSTRYMRLGDLIEKINSSVISSLYCAQRALIVCY